MYKVVAPVVVELIFVQVSGEQRARTRLHATHLHQLTLRLCSAVFIGTCIPLHALSYACMLHGHIPTCMYVYAVRSRDNLLILRNGSTDSSYSVVDIDFGS